MNQDTVPRSWKAPPVYQEGHSNEEYKRDIQIWILLKVATREESGLLVYRTLTGRAKASCNDLTPDEIASEDGLDLILQRLDTLFLGDDNLRIYRDLDVFEKFRRVNGMSMTDFILEFENLHNKIRSHEISYPDGILAYRLIKSANLSGYHEELLKATVATGSWNYATVDDQLRKIFNNTPSISTCSPTNLPIKVENQTYHAQASFPIDPMLANYENPDFYDYQEYEYEDRYEHGQDQLYQPNEDYSVYYTPQPNIYKPKPRYPFKYNNAPPKFVPRNFNPPGPSKFPGPRYVKPFNSMRISEGRPPTEGEYRNLKSLYNPNNNVPNPKDSKGNFTICRRCRSIYHWIADCPHNTNIPEKQNNANSYYTKSLEDEVYIALLQSCDPCPPDRISNLVKETWCHAVVDSGCSKTVAGKSWYEVYCESLNDEERSSIIEENSNAIFKFGDSKAVESMKKVYLPVVIGKKNVSLEVEIVESDVPLLLSKASLIKLEAEISCKDSSITFFGNKQDLICTESGHYAIPLTEALNTSSNEIHTILFTNKNSNNQDHSTIARKLHQQFAHPSAKRLIDLIKTSGCDDNELFKAIQNVSQICDTCKRYKKAPPKPSVTFPLATQFNETVALDLKIYENNKTYFLHVIDHATRFSAAAVITSKKKEIIVDQFFKIWIAVFGTPQKVLSDNGGEFSNELFEDMCLNFNIKMTTTAAESPWSNGLVERHNGVLGEAVSKILEVDCSLEVALCWAVNAKNTLLNIYGFSPYQLVFGSNPNLPSILTSKLPALEGVTSSYLIANHLNALHKAREHVIKVEASEKLRRAMRSKTRTHSNIQYLPKDKVYFKREDEKRWRYGEVINHSGSKVLITTPRGHIISCHSSRVRLTGEQEENRNSNADEISTKDGDENDGEIKTTPENQQPVHNRGDTLPDLVDDEYDEPNLNSISSNTNLQSTPTDMSANNTDTNISEPELSDDSDHDVTPLSQSLSELVAPTPPDSIPSASQKLPKKNQCVKYRLPESNEWVTVKILDRGGKVGGKHESYLNVKRLEDNIDYGVDFNKVAEWSPVLWANVFLGSCKNDKFEESRQKELANWKQMGVYEEVDDEGQQAISVKWVYKEKIQNDQHKMKARLVARGYEEQQDLLTDSPTCNKDSLRTILAIISSFDWTVNSFDVKAAFLQGKELDRELYLRPPKQANAPGKLWRLRRCVYGLNDASRYWYMRIREELLKLNCQCSQADPSVFFFRSSGLEGLMISHVDDFIWAGTNKFVSEVIDRIKTIFSISAEDSTAFRYIGIDIFQDKTGIFANQAKYVEELQEIDVKHIKKEDKYLPVNELERKQLRSVIGQLNWLSTQTRPDISFAVSSLGSSVMKATKKDLFLANKIIRICKMNPVSLYFPKLDLHNLTVRCYADASYGKLQDGGSQGGMFIELCSNGQSAPIFWQSKKINRVVDNVMAAEALSMKDALDEGFLIKSLLNELLSHNNSDIVLEAMTDSRSLYECVHSTKSGKDKRLRIDLSIIREYVSSDKCRFSWVSTGQQLADVLTKYGVDGSNIRNHISGQ